MAPGPSKNRHGTPARNVCPPANPTSSRGVPTLLMSSRHPPMPRVGRLALQVQDQGVVEAPHCGHDAEPGQVGQFWCGVVPDFIA